MIGGLTFLFLSVFTMSLSINAVSLFGVDDYIIPGTILLSVSITSLAAAIIILVKGMYE